VALETELPRMVLRVLLELRRPRVRNKPETPNSSRAPLPLQALRHRRPETPPSNKLQLLLLQRLRHLVKLLNNRLTPRRTLVQLLQHHQARPHNNRPVARLAAMPVPKVRTLVRRELGLEAGLERRPRLTSKTVPDDSGVKSRGVMCWSRNP
jgi:hypothetical protein